jgi:apolipoprotein N-acyltransferase
MSFFGKLFSYKKTLFFLSLLIVAFGQNSWISVLGIFSACIGYGLFFVSIQNEVPKRRFLLSLFWYALVQAIQLSWMTSLEYQGFYILFVYAALLCLLGLEFSLIPLWVFSKTALSFRKILAIASLLVILEWSRLFFFCGFTWSPIGIALASYPISMQLSAVFGVFGLSFWVMLTNLIFYKMLLEKQKNLFYFWLSLAIFPYFLGFLHQEILSEIFPDKEKLSVALIQTNLRPEQKEFYPHLSVSFLSPYEQWNRVIKQLQTTTEKLDMIVFPEAALPFGAFQYFYPVEQVKRFWNQQIGSSYDQFFPSLQEPFIQQKASNALFAQVLANYFQAEVIIGLDDQDQQKSYNAAFYFSPFSPKPLRYEKRVLLPMVEYFPFAWCQKVAAQYGIGGEFTPGKESKIFGKKVPFSISICYEETFGNIIRESKSKGAKLLVNITNDGWFPSSRLPKAHFEHARLRAVETGLPLLRSCNTGVTAAVDPFGRILYEFTNAQGSYETFGVLFAKIPLSSHPTLYSFWGDFCILILSGFSILSFLAERAIEMALKKKKKEI